MIECGWLLMYVERSRSRTHRRAPTPEGVGHPIDFTRERIVAQVQHIHATRPLADARGSEFGRMKKPPHIGSRVAQPLRGMGRDDRTANEITRCASGAIRVRIVASAPVRAAVSSRRSTARTSGKIRHAEDSEAQSHCPVPPGIRTPPPIDFTRERIVARFQRTHATRPLADARGSKLGRMKKAAPSHEAALNSLTTVSFDQSA